MNLIRIVTTVNKVSFATEQSLMEIVNLILRGNPITYFDKENEEQVEVFFLATQLVSVSQRTFKVTNVEEDLSPINIEGFVDVITRG